MEEVIERYSKLRNVADFANKMDQIIDKIHSIGNNLASIDIIGLD